MSYFFYNTDGKSFGEPRPRFRTLIANGIAATGGDSTFGEKLAQLKPGDTLLMYENGIGVVAVGRVLEHWDRKPHNQLLYYNASNRQKEIGDTGHEYRIRVNWRDLSERPIGLAEIKERLGYIPRGAIRRIARSQAEAAQMVADRLRARLQLAGDKIRANEQPTLKAIMATNRITIAEVQLVLEKVRFEEDDREMPPSPRRRAKFREGWRDAAVRKEAYVESTFLRLTWQNLGYRFGDALGDRTDEEIDFAYDHVVNWYGQPPGEAPSSEIGESIKTPPARVQTTTTRIVRDTAAARRLKGLYAHRCQVCRDRIELGSGHFYSEVHHIRPLGGQHEGSDTDDNMLVVCPTHHAVFDLCAARFMSEKTVEIHGKRRRLTLKHQLAYKNIEYHNIEHAYRSELRGLKNKSPDQ